jgi:HSP20 family protein
MAAHESREWMWNEACALIERATRLHRTFFQPGFLSATTPSWEPPIDVFETDRSVHIIAALPGVEPQDFSVELDGPDMVIKGVRRLPSVPRETAIHRLEIPFGRFERRIRLTMGRLGLDHSELASGCLSIRLTKLP